MIVRRPESNQILISDDIFYIINKNPWKPQLSTKLAVQKIKPLIFLFTNQAQSHELSINPQFFCLRGRNESLSADDVDGLQSSKMGCAESTNQAHLPLGNTPENHAIESCPPDSWPALQPNYKPTGTTHEVYGVKMYEAGHGKIGLVIFSDLFGIEFGRHKALADTIGSLGFNVFMPEMLSPPYSGPPGDFAKMSEAIKQQKMAVMEEKYEKLTKYLNYNDHKKFLVVSMSWGSWFAFKMSAKYDNIKAIACIHPAFMVETICGGSEQKLFENVKCPSYMALSKSEGASLRPGGDLHAILQRKFGAKAVCEDFPEMEHGFATRGDVSVEKIKRDNRRAIKGVYDYLNLFI